MYKYHWADNIRPYKGCNNSVGEDIIFPQNP